MTKTTVTRAKRSSAPFLLEPLGWVRDRLGAAVQHEPNTLGLLLGVDKTRMHLIALVLAHQSDNVSPNLAHSLLSQSNDEVLVLVETHNVTGLSRILSRLPKAVLAAEDYRALLDLLSDGTTRTFLHHATVIDGATIRALHNLPAELRTPAVMPLLKQVEGMEQFADGLRFLSARSSSSLIALINHLKSLGQPEQIAASIKRLVDALPLPDIAPSIQIGSFRRIDAPREIRRLAKEWHNCLADCVFSVDDGSSAIYISERLKTICLVTRHGRIGWFLHQVKGPQNAEIEPGILASIRDDFARAGIFEPSIIEPITAIIHNRGWKSRNLNFHHFAEDEFF